LIADKSAMHSRMFCCHCKTHGFKGPSTIGTLAASRCAKVCTYLYDAQDQTILSVTARGLFAAVVDVVSKEIIVLVLKKPFRSVLKR
jgi:hypothetical protein